MLIITRCILRITQSSRDVIDVPLVGTRRSHVLAVTDESCLLGFNNDVDNNANNNDDKPSYNINTADNNTTNNDNNIYNNYNNKNKLRAGEADGTSILRPRRL